MILLHHANQRSRRGAIAPLAAIMLVFFMFLVAVAVDLGYVANVRAELQNAADSAALAGASQLLDNNILQAGDFRGENNEAPLQHACRARGSSGPAWA